jgi:RNA polymerase sigma factor (sigma-70 family)
LAAVPSTGRADQVDRLAAPEADATRALYERYANQIFGYCLHQLGSREEAEDAVQSTFLNAFRGLKRGVVPEMEAAWLFKIAHNVCLSRRRSSWRRGRIESPADFEVVEELAPAPSRRSDELIGLQDVLETMPENQRRAILLREWQGLSYHEIADELGLSQSAVETLIFRARRSLASGLEQPPETAKKRLRARAGDLGNLLAGIKSMLLGSAAAVKVAATVAVISATTVVAAAPVQNHVHHATPVAPSSSTSPRSAGAGGTTLVQAPLARLQRGAVTAASKHAGGAGKSSFGLSVGAPFGPAVVDGTAAPTDAQTSTAPSTPQPSGDQPAQQPSQPEGPAPTAPPAGQGATPAPAPKTQDTSSGSGGTDTGQTTVSTPLSQTTTPGLSETNGQDQSGSGSSGSSSSSGQSSSGQTTTPVSTARSLPVPPIPVPAPIAATPVTTTPVTTDPVTTSPPPTQTTTTTTVTGGPLSQHVSPGLSTTSGSASSGTTTTPPAVTQTTTTLSVPVPPVTVGSGTVTGKPKIGTGTGTVTKNP